MSKIWLLLTAIVLVTAGSVLAQDYAAGYGPPPNGDAIMIGPAAPGLRFGGVPSTVYGDGAPGPYYGGAPCSGCKYGLICLDWKITQWYAHWSNCAENQARRASRACCPE